MKSRSAFLAIAALTAVAAAPIAAAQAQDATAVVKERQEHMKALGSAMKVLGSYVKNEGPSLEEARKAGEKLQENAKLDIKALFPEGTGVGVGKSAAKPDIWQNWAEFEKVAGALPGAADKLAQALDEGERSKIAPAFAGVGKACGSCHETFRQKKS